jgi:hypothetical protein
MEAQSRDVFDLTVMDLLRLKATTLENAFALNVFSDGAVSVKWIGTLD